MMKSKNFLKEAGGNFVDSPTGRIKILDQIEDAPTVSNNQIETRTSSTGRTFRLAIGVEIPELGSRNLMVRSSIEKEQYRVHGVSYIQDVVNPETNEVKVKKGSFAYCVL